MPIVTVEIYEGRTIEQKKKLVEDITSAIATNLAVSPEAVWIIIKDNPKHNCAQGGKLASEYLP